MASWPPAEYFANLAVPSSWTNVDEFADWYMAAGMPMMIPSNAQVFCADVATSISLFRRGRFQVELYLMHPEATTPIHAHPGMDSLIVQLGGGSVSGTDAVTGLSEEWGMKGGVLYSGNKHGGKDLEVSTGGCAMLTFEHWPEGVEVTSAAILWSGATTGPQQDALIKRFLPKAYVSPGMADAYRVFGN